MVRETTHAPNWYPSSHKNERTVSRLRQRKKKNGLHNLALLHLFYFICCKKLESGNVSPVYVMQVFPIAILSLRLLLSLLALVNINKRKP